MKDQVFWNKIPPSAVALIRAKAKNIVLKRHDRVYSIGDQPKGIYILNKGLVGLVALSDKGTEHLLRIYRTHDFFGHRSYFADEKYHANAVCLETTELSLVPPEIVESILRDFPETQRILITQLSRELGSAEMQRISITDFEVLKRIADALVYLKEMNPNHPWTRTEIAQYCASTTPTVIRGLAELESRGLIRQSGRQIEIPNRDALLNVE